MNISQQFSPPLKYVRPYFIAGSIFYLLSMFMLYFIDVSALNILDPIVVSFTHTFLIAFVMMYIFASSIQILPVVFESEHKHLDFFKYIWLFITFGVVFMVVGFLFYSTFIPIGGSIILLALIFQLYNFFFTIRGSKKNNFSLKTIVASNIFLFLGVLVGVYMALAHSGLVQTNLLTILPSHIFLLVGGFIFLNIMGVSMVLLPMFGTTRGFTKVPIKISVFTMSLAILISLISNFFDYLILKYLSSFFVIVSLSIYIYQMFLIYKNRVRKDFDIYIKALMISALSLVFFLIFFIVYLIKDDINYLFEALWMMFGGFFAFIIIAHLYRIVPFLVWFHRFSPYIEEKEVPMLHDMYNEQHGLIQLYLSLFGLVFISIGIFLQNAYIFKAGVCFSIVGSLFLTYIIAKIFLVK